MKDKHIVIIQTPVSSKSFTQVTTLMDDDELREAKLERPDLEFILASELPVSQEQEEVKEPEQALAQETQNLREDQGITVTGMTLPHNLDELISKVLEDK